MSVGFPINPPNAQLVLPDGRCTNEWYRFFLQIQRAIGGPNSPWDDTALLASQPDVGAYARAVEGRDDDLTGPRVVTVVPDDYLLPPCTYSAPDDFLPPMQGAALAQIIATYNELIAAANPFPQYQLGGGALTLKTRTITATGGVNADDYLLLVDATAGAVVVNYPAAASNAGRILTVKKIDASANTVTIDGNAAETIDGAATQVIVTQYTSLTTQCNGTAWWIV